MASASRLSTAWPASSAAHGLLDLLAADRVGDVGDGDTRARARAGVSSRVRIVCLTVRTSSSVSSAPPASFRHSTTSTSPATSRPDHDRVRRSRAGAQRAVDLGRADADAARVERGVAAAVDDHAAVRADLDEVAVRPDAGVLLEVGVAVLRRRRGRSRSPTGMEGNGRVQTSSPFSPTTAGRPRLQASTAMPSARPWSSPRRTGRVGTPPTKQPSRSVPPLIGGAGAVGLPRGRRPSRTARG